MSHLLIHKAQGIATLTLNRPEVHNAFDDALIAAIVSALNDVEQDPNVRVVMLAASGKHFSAGADLAWMKRMAELDEAQNQADAQDLAELMYRLNHLSKPTIALVNGAAYGGAVGLIACCDMAIATQRSRFCLSEVKIGLSPAVISPFVIRAMGERQARRYFLSAEVFDAQQAERFELIHQVVENEEALITAGDILAQGLLQNSPQAVSKTKALIQTVSGAALNSDTRNYTVKLIAGIRVSDEGQEGLSAFLEKRSPSWQVLAAKDNG